MARVRLSAPPRVVLHKRDTPEVEPQVPRVALGTLLAIAHSKLAEIHAQAPGLTLLEKEIARLQAQPLGADAARVYERAERLLDVLASAAPAITSLAALRDPKAFIPGVAGAITSEAKRISDLYAMAILSSFAEVEPQPPRIDAAEKAMAGFPDFISREYLGHTGINQLIHQVTMQWERVQACRAVTGRAMVNRPAGHPARSRRPPRNDHRSATEGARLARQAFARHDQDAFTRITELTEDTQMVLSSVSALAAYEQYSVWAKELADHWVLDAYDSRLPAARRWLGEFDAIVRDFETYDLSSPLPTRQAVIRNGTGRLRAGPDQPRTRSDLGPDRRAARDHRDGQPARPCGADHRRRCPDRRRGGSRRGACSRPRRSVRLCRRLRSLRRRGPRLHRGQPGRASGGLRTAGDSWAHDLFWNSLTLGSVKGVGLAFSRAMRSSMGARAIMLGVGRTATTGLVLHGVAEVQAAVSPGGPMGSEARYRAVVQNVFMLAGFELGGFLIKPMGSRLGGAIGARFTEAFRNELQVLDGERTGLVQQLEALHRATAKPADVNAVLDQIQRIIAREMQLLDLAGRRGILSAAQLQSAMTPYRTAIDRLVLRFSPAEPVRPDGRPTGGLPAARPWRRGVRAGRSRPHRQPLQRARRPVARAPRGRSAGVGRQRGGHLFRARGGDLAAPPGLPGCRRGARRRAAGGPSRRYRRGGPCRLQDPGAGTRC